jgi:group I intron endonuclease
MSSIYSNSTIYEATCTINGKKYIGFSTNFKKRKNIHKRLAEEGNQQVFYIAIRKYGWDNFEWKILYQSWDKQHCKNIMENYFIVEHRTYLGFEDCNGYNMTLGGDGTVGHKHTEEYKKNSSERMLKHNPFRGNTNTEESNRKRSESLLEYYRDNPVSLEECVKISQRLYNYYSNNKVSESTRKKLSISATGKIPSSESKQKNRESQYKRYAEHPDTAETLKKKSESQKKYNLIKKECECCGEFVSGTTYNRWHGKNCRKKINI